MAEPTKSPSTAASKRQRVQMFLGDELLADSEQPISSEEAEARIERALLKLPAHLRPDPAHNRGQDYADHQAEGPKRPRP